MNRNRKMLLGAVVGLLPSLSCYAQLSPQQSADTFTMAPGLQAAVWAHEPEMVNPTNIDIDERGRVWVLEAANYRGSNTRPEGDRILILEDTHHTGKCDSYKVFAQNKQIHAPLGICKLGNKLIVAQSPDVLVYTIDSSGDHPAGEPQVLFSGFGGVNHDHGVHAGVFGPDGMFYFNCGNKGGENVIENAQGKPIIDITGSEVGSHAQIYHGKPKPKGFLGPREGFAFRCNLDGSQFEILGYNFRNNYELCVDSFGTVWQSDNDDDGNQSCAINYVMEGGDFGYNGPRGSGWKRDESIFPGQTRQEAHWHQRWPGVVPNLLHTGAGAPCGICVYEGALLPEKYHGALIHADAGPNVVRAYITEPSEHVAKGIMNNDGDESAQEKTGAGFKAESVDLIKAKDRWFRPDDVCVAPDGSVYVSDWYDPGVGGHATGDTGAHQHNWRTLHGRIFRLSPDGNKPSLPPMDLKTVAGQIAALESPNQSRRYLGYTALLAGGADAEQGLKSVFESKADPRFRARALWLLARRPDGRQSVERALKDKDSDIRVTAVRAAREIKMDMVALADQMLSDPSPAVLRELCLAMQFEPDARAIPVLVKLADKYDGTDRWYLEAFGIGAAGREKQVLAAWKADHQNKNPAAERGIEWRLRMEPVPVDQAASALTTDQLVTNWLAVGPFPSPDAKAADTNFGPDSSPAAIDPAASYTGVGNKPVHWEVVHTTAGDESAPQWIDFNKFCADRHFPTDNVIGYFATDIVAEADQPAQLRVGSDDGVKVWLNGKLVIDNAQTTRAVSLGDDEMPVNLKKGVNVLLCKLRQGNSASGLTVAVRTSKPVRFDTGAKSSAAAPAASPAVVDKAGTFLTRDGRQLPPIDQLAKLAGDARAGEAAFRNTNGANCIRCHQMGNDGGIVGPPLTVIGAKLSKPQLYEAILYPSAAVEMGYETWVVKTKSGEVLTGRKVEDTDDHVTILDADGKYHDVPVNQIDRKVQQKISIMPEGLSQAMTQQDLVNLVEFLSQRK